MLVIPMIIIEVHSKISLSSKNRKMILKEALMSCFTFVVFDILEKDGKPLVNLPLCERKQILRDSVVEGKQVCKNKVNYFFP